MTWEQRWHPLRREWVVVAAHRQNRPWNTEQLNRSERVLPEYVSDCYLCPRNLRVSGARNADYAGVFVFDNDHPCVGPEAPTQLVAPPGIYRSRPATGIARVVCYTPRHDLSLAELDVASIVALMEVWQEQYRELSARAEVRHVLVFENRGEAVGVSNPHPHCQIYATNFVFKGMEVELDAERAHLEETGRVLFQDILAAERADGRRWLVENAGAVAFLPYFARYAYDAIVCPKATHPSIAELSPGELRDLAAALHGLLVRFDNLWQMPFPYVLALHQAPTDGADYRHHHFHIQIHPPLRKPNLLKYLAGPEVGAGGFISDTAPEDKAAELRAVPAVHYRSGR
ncbi:MAG TPA: galactose-1-phosphate uridylyltransferase [Hyphomicrobiaceae bacterium]|nr:galactose-1-phosphate uridylyltransferase [Hyphomicrobiaceae bacterium]